jgi:hypothetical protein
MNFAVSYHNFFVFFQLLCMGQSFFMVTTSGPGITKININPLNSILWRKHFRDAFNVPGHDLDIVDREIGFSIGCFYVSFGEPQNGIDQIDGQIIEFRMSAAQFSNKSPFSAAQFYMKGLFFGEKLLPLSPVIRGICLKKAAALQLGTGPGFWSYVHSVLLVWFFFTFLKYKT